MRPISISLGCRWTSGATKSIIPKRPAKYEDHFTWAVLKGHTDNCSGYVKLKSKIPFDTPEINFKIFRGELSKIR